MATRKPAHGAKKKARKAGSKATGKAASETRKKAEPARPPRAKRTATPTHDAKRLRAAEAGEHGFGRTASVEAGIAALRRRLRASPANERMFRNRHGREADRLDAALKRLGDSYRDLFK